MSTDSNGNDITISRTSSGFPAYLDFKSLRTDAINYLGPITKKYWTDYNIHDPGITLLEALMYAILDLGYRVNFPIEDLLARTPDDKTKDSNFFTPAQLLGSNPLTINDYRKKLMDIDEVRNAWLEIDNTQPVTSEKNPYINGLYQVHLELEMDFTDFATHEEWENYQNKIHKKVRSILNAHRNVCEDFNKIHFLKKKYYGVNADIELDQDAVPGTVYQILAKALQDFFSPVPTFYTLGQLTSMDISLDQIFEGRPYNGLASHGFILDEELPDRPSASTPIYRSALYQQMMQVTGIKSVKKFQLIDPDNKKQFKQETDDKWEFTIDEEQIPSFSLTGSQFNWYKNGKLLSTDLSSYDNSIQLNITHSGKMLYPAGSPALDQGVQNGNYMPELGDYYSIQNDFPLVYGIGQGGLPSTASDLRQSQALQFKGFILFFDQLLANYLAQLVNIRNIFSLSPSGVQDDSKTYYTADLSKSSVPGLNNLLRFPTPGTDAENQANPGTTLALPVDLKDWNLVIQTGVVDCTGLQQLKPITFTSVNERNIVVEELALAFFTAELQPAPQYIQTDAGSFMYFFSWSWTDIVLISKNNFPTQAAASKEIYTVLFIAGSKENYSLLTTAENSSYGFNLVQSALSYNNYLQSMLEDPGQYEERRTVFLQHLMSRFAETFTDYALLEAGFISPDEITSNQVSLIEKFLGNFPSLSANRARAFDYLHSGWENENISGYEKRFKAYCGIENWNQHDLCNFEVHQFEGRYNIKMALAGEDLFHCSSPFQEKETITALHSLNKCMSDRSHLRIFGYSEQSGYVIEVHFLDRYIARSVIVWQDEEEANTMADRISKMWKLYPEQKDVYISEYRYRAELLDTDRRISRTAVTGFPTEHLAWTEGKKMVKKINDPAVWHFEEIQGFRTIGELHQNHEPGLENQYFDVSGFKIYEKEVVEKEGRYRFEVLDQHNTFQFESLNDYPSVASAKSACRQFLHYLTVRSNLPIRENPYGKIFRIWVRVNDEDLAVGEKEFPDQEAAISRRDSIVNTLKQRLYTLQVIPEPFKWKFIFYLGLPGGDSFLFRSMEAFHSRDIAWKAAQDFHQNGQHLSLKNEDGEWLIKEKSNDGNIFCQLEKSADLQEIPDNEIEGKIHHLLKAKEEIYKLGEGNKKVMEKLVNPDEPSKEGTWVYRLVDKDHPRAFHFGYAKIKEKEEASIIREKLILKGRKGYFYPEFCLGGDNVYLNESDGKFYFQIRCRNDYFSRKGIHAKHGELVLFESMESFDSADTAQLAFQRDYLIILKSAMDASHYEYGNPILLKYRTVQPGTSSYKQVSVKVPADTRDALAYAALNPIESLVEAATAYPIRMVRDVYRFVIVNDENGKTDWESPAHFQVPGDAHNAFDFFLLLLNYPGNYFIEYDEPACSFRIGIREVLAESSNSFKKPEDAWGQNGVEKFICVAQSEGSFHLNRKKDCSYSFFAACRNHRAIHPCHYDTIDHRDHALLKLFEEAGKFPKQGWIGGIDDNGFAILDGITGHPLAAIPQFKDDPTVFDRLNDILDMADALWKGNQFAEDESGIYLLSGGNQLRIRPVHHIAHIDKWEKELLVFIAYFPITRTTQIQGGKTSAEYRLEIKLPGFVDLPGTKATGKDCGCSPPSSPPNMVTCFEAWRNDKKYNIIEDVWSDYLNLIPILKVLENYRPVFDDACGCHGIELYEKRDIIASNPQYYTYPAMAVNALSRAVTCINAEGLDLVEHILLRPKLIGEDKKHIPVCPDKSECLSVWKSVQDPNAPNDRSVYFQPGLDPYSFIMTVALPAWPIRFRKKENRVLLESILQREAPSHIMTRILWLTPMDMCRFETLYKNWKYWLAREKGWEETERCGDFEPARFIEFLFGTSFQCLSNCFECNEEPKEHVNKSYTTDITRQNDEWLSQINLLYCWEDRRCADTKYWTIKRTEVNPDLPPPMEPTGTMITKEALDSFKEKIEDEYLQNLSDRRSLFTKRVEAYRLRTKELSEQAGEQLKSGRVLSFLLDHNPSMERFENEIKKLRQGSPRALGKGGRKSEAASKKYIQSLIEILISFYLDKVSDDPGDGQKWDHIEKTIRKYKIKFEDPGQFYEGWNPHEMRRLVRNLDTERIQSIMRMEKNK